MSPAARDPRAEAQALLTDGYVARVLEPSPPADTDPDWYARDEAAPGKVPDGVRVVGPTSAADITWDELAQTDDNAAAFARERWVGDHRRLGPAPDGLVAARADLNRLAFYVLSQARSAANGKIAVRWTKGGFGTPFYADDVQLRLDGMDVVLQRGITVRSVELTSLAAAADLAGITLDPSARGEFDVPSLGDAERTVDVAEHHVAFISDWFGFATSVLEELRVAGRHADGVGRVQIWPEHFDAAVEIGSADAGRRASFGASPGDAAHDEPYLYVAPWRPVDDAASPNDPSFRNDPDFWNDDAFGGAALGLDELLAARDQRSSALDFYLRGMRALGMDPDDG